MRLRFVSVIVALTVPALAGAQDFGVMGSAETINRGNFKLMANPMWVFPEGSDDSEFGVTLLLGYGFTDRVDAEVKVALFDKVKFIGGDVEYWIVRNQGLDLSATGGVHFGNGDHGVANTSGIDFSVEGSGHVTRRLELYGAVDFAFNAFEKRDKFELFDNDYTTAHFVPGIEYALSNDLDFVTEFGVALNDDSSNYFSFGLAYYIR